MPSNKTLKAKQELVSSLADEFKQAQTLVVASARGLTVSEDTEMRAEMRKAGIVYKVIKNTMAVRAVKEAGIEGLDDIFVGPTAIAYSTEDVIAPAKLTKQFAKKFEAFEIKGGMTGGVASSLDELNRLASIPDQTTLYTQLAYVLNFPIQKLAATLKAVVDKGEEVSKEMVCDLVAENANQSQETEAEVTE